MAMIVEVDPDTYAVKIDKCVIVHDCGTVINPMMLEGQVHGRGLDGCRQLLLRAADVR